MVRKSFFDKKNYANELKKLKLINEFKKWYEGGSEDLLKYYKRGEYLQDKTIAGITDTSLMTRNFYMLAPVGTQFNTVGGYQINSFSVLHRPLAKVISRTFAVLIAGQKPEIVISTKNKSKTKELQERVDKMLEMNDFGAKIQLASEYESYSGSVAFKPILTEGIDAPLFQIYPKDRFIINESFESILNSVVFVDYFKDSENNTYTLLSEYGRGFIKYKLLDKNNAEQPLNKVDELADLRDIEIFDIKGAPYDKVLAVVQKNRGTGESDYKDLVDNFQAVDEAFSIMINLIRKSQPKRIVSEASLKRGVADDGSPIYSIPDSYDSDVIVMWDNRQGDQQEVNELQPAPNLENPISAYKQTIDSALLDIASSVGLSSKTLSGVEDAGANASAEALGLRSNVDYRTRDLKVQSWKKSINDLVKLLVALQSIQGASIQVNTDEFDVTVNLYDPANFQAGKPALKQKIETMQLAYKNNLIDLRGALDYIWGDTKTAEEIDALFAELSITETLPDDGGVGEENKNKEDEKEDKE